MENLVSKIYELHNQYEKSEKVLGKLNYYIHTQLPSLLEKYNEKENKRLYVEKEKKIYINDFLSNPETQYFYISSTETFIKYDGENYTYLNEDELWFTILNNITNNDDEHTPIKEHKEKIKNTIITLIKKRTLFDTIPESYTVQHIINFFTPTLFNTKEDVKYFLAVLGDSILNKKSNLVYFVNSKSKDFFETLESFCEFNFRSKLNITSNIKYTYRGNSHDDIRLINFKRAIANRSCWLSFLKDNIFNLIVVCCHYSARYINAENYLSKQNTTLKNEIFYIKNTTKEDIIQTFLDSMIQSETNAGIHIKDIYFLWKIYLKQKNLPNVIYKANFENIIREKLSYTYSNFLGIKSNYLVNVSYFKDFFTNNIILSVNDILEISEMHKLLIKWLNDNNKVYEGFTEENMKDMLEYFYDGIEIENDKFMMGVKCVLWDKKKDISEAVQKKFNKTITSDLSLYDAYVMYCKYSNNNGKLLTVSKKYFYKYIDRIIPEQYIQNNYILFSFWKN